MKAYALNISTCHRMDADTDDASCSIAAKGRKLCSQRSAADFYLFEPVGSYLKHPQVHVGGWVEAATADKNDWPVAVPVTVGPGFQLACQLVRVLVVQL